MEGILNMISLSPDICPFLVCNLLFANSREQLCEIIKYALILMDPCHKNHCLNLGSEDVQGKNLILFSVFVHMFSKDPMTCSLSKACVSLLFDKVHYEAGLLVCCCSSSMRTDKQVNLTYSHVVGVDNTLVKCELL